MNSINKGRSIDPFAKPINRAPLEIDKIII